VYFSGGTDIQLRLDNIAVRGLRRFTVHCIVPLIVPQARALSMPESPSHAVAA